MKALMIYIADWMTSTKIKAMSGDEERGYFRLLLHMADDPTCSLPDNDKLLSVWSMLEKDWFKPTRNRDYRVGNQTSGEKLRENFFVENGRIYNARLLREWNRQHDYSASRSKAGVFGNIRKAELREQARTFSQDFAQKMNGNQNGIIEVSQQLNPSETTHMRPVCERTLTLNSYISKREEREKEKEREVPAKKLPSLDVPNTTEPQSYAGPHDSAQRSIRTPSPVLEENWFTFRGKFAEVSVPATEEQWAAAHHVWRIMDPGQRKAATDFLDTPGAQDPEYFKVSKSSPATFLRNRIWTLPVPQRKKCSPNATAHGAPSYETVLRRQEETIARELAMAAKGVNGGGFHA